MDNSETEHETTLRLLKRATFEEMRRLYADAYNFKDYDHYEVINGKRVLVKSTVTKRKHYIDSVLAENGWTEEELLTY